jgi:hypothetical protein
MANGGAFGNPLTTGIALNFEVDMTPYRQMMQDNLQFAQTQAAERNKKEKEFQDILKNIAYDDSKIHARMRPEARLEYASTINDVINLKKNNDFGGIMNRIAEGNSKLNNYVDGTTNFRAYEKAAADGTNWVDNEYITAFNNPEKFSTADLIDNFSAVATYDKEAGVFSAQAIPKQDALAFVNKYMGGMQYNFEIDNGKVGSDARQTGTGAYVYRKSKSEDPESFYRKLGVAWLGGGRNNIEDMRRNLNLKPEDLEGTIDTPSGPVPKSLHYATEFMRKFAEPQMYSDVTGSPPAQKTTKPTYTFGEDSIGDVAFSGTTPSGITSEAPTPEQEQQALTNELTSTIQRYLDDAKTADPNNVEDKLSDPITKNFLANYGLKMEVPFTYGEEVEVLTEGGTSLGVFDPTSQSFVQDLTNIVLEKGAKVMENTPNITPETTVEEFLKPESNAFTVQMAGGKTPKTDWSIPGGTTVILAGDDGSVEVKLRNDITLQGGKFQKAANYEDKSGKVDTYYDIMFPIEYQGNDDLFADFFGDDDALSQFKLKNRNQLPKSLYVKEDENTFNTLLSILQTRETKGEMNKSVLQKAMDKYMKPLSGSGTQSSGSSGEEEVDEFGFPIEN